MSRLSPCLFNLYAEHIMQDWMNHKVESRFLGEISKPQICRRYTLMAESEEELKSLLMRVKEKSEKVGLKLTIQKLRSWHTGPLIPGKYMGKKWKPWKLLFSWAPPSLRTVTAATKLKDARSLDEKLCQI